MTAPSRWRPDEQLVEAIVASPGKTYRMIDLPDADRAWVVAGLTARRFTADEIAARLDCSRRLVCTIRAHPMTAVCALLISESEHFTDELRLIRAEASAMTSQLGIVQAERDRLRSQLIRAIAPKDPTGKPLCSKGKHRMSEANTYRYRDARGRERVQCRGCHAERQEDYRARCDSKTPTFV